MGRPRAARARLGPTLLGAGLAVYAPFLLPLLASHVAHCGDCRSNWLAGFPGLPGLLPTTLLSAWLEEPLNSSASGFLLVPTVLALALVLLVTLLARRGVRARRITLAATALLAAANAFALANAFAA